MLHSDDIGVTDTMAGSTALATPRKAARHEDVNRQVAVLAIRGATDTHNNGLARRLFQVERDSRQYSRQYTATIENSVSIHPDLLEPIPRILKPLDTPDDRGVSRQISIFETSRLVFVVFTIRAATCLDGHSQSFYRLLLVDVREIHVTN